MKFIFSCCYFCLLALYIVSVDFDVDVLRCWLYIFCCTRSVLIIPAYSKHQHRALFHVIKQTRCTNFSNLFWNATLHVSDSSSVQHQEFFTVHTAMVCHTGLLTACKQHRMELQFHSDPARKLSANLYDIYHCCVYSEKLLTMDWGTVRNMQSCIPRQIWEISASGWFYYKKFVTMHGNMNIKHQHKDYTHKTVQTVNVATKQTTSKYYN